MTAAGRPDYYVGVLTGALMVLAFQLVGLPVHWWQPIAWVAVSVLIEAAWGLARRAYRKRQQATA